MSFYVENKGGGFDPCPTGIHLANCYRIIDLGTQKIEYMGQSKFQHKVMFAWELHITDDNGNQVKMNDGRPFSIFKNYTLSWSDKSNLRQDLQSWRGKPFTQEELNRFDLKNVLGAWGMVNVIERQGQNGKTYANVSGITPVPSMIRQQGLPQRVNKLELFTLSNPDMEMFNSFSDNLKQKISSSPEWQKLSVKEPQKEYSAFADTDEEIPF
jgi:hypothetical protein